MKTQERLKRLIDRIKLYIADEGDVLSELRDLLHDFDGVKGDANYRDKIESSMEWAAMFFRPQKSSPPDARAFLLANLATAADLAADMDHRFA
jgi:hypothetical protein